MAASEALVITAEVIPTGVATDSKLTTRLPLTLAGSITPTITSTYDVDLICRVRSVSLTAASTTTAWVGQGARITLKPTIDDTLTTLTITLPNTTKYKNGAGNVSTADGAAALAGLSLYPTEELPALEVHADSSVVPSGGGNTADVYCFLAENDESSDFSGFTAFGITVNGAGTTGDVPTINGGALNQTIDLSGAVGVVTPTLHKDDSTDLICRVEAVGGSTTLTRGKGTKITINAITSDTDATSSTAVKFSVADGDAIKDSTGVFYTDDGSAATLTGITLYPGERLPANITLTVAPTNAGTFGMFCFTSDGDSSSPLGVNATTNRGGSQNGTELSITPDDTNEDDTPAISFSSGSVTAVDSDATATTFYLICRIADTDGVTDAPEDFTSADDYIKTSTATTASAVQGQGFRIPIRVATIDRNTNLKVRAISGAIIRDLAGAVYADGAEIGAGTAGTGNGVLLMPGQSLGSLLEVAITDTSTIGDNVADNATVDCYIDPVTTDIRVTTDCNDVATAANGCDVTEAQFFGLDLADARIDVPSTISYAACAVGATDCSGAAAIATTFTTTAAAYNMVSNLTAVTDRTFNVTCRVTAITNGGGTTGSTLSLGEGAKFTVTIADSYYPTLQVASGQVVYEKSTGELITEGAEIQYTTSDTVVAKDTPIMLVGEGDLALTFTPAEAPASDLTYECFSDNPSLVPDFDIVATADDAGAAVAVALPGVTADTYLGSGNTATDVVFTCAPAARVGKVEPWMSFAFHVHVSTKLVVVVGTGANGRATASDVTLVTNQDITAPATGVDCKTVVVYEGETAITQLAKVYSPIRPAGGADVTITCTDANGYLTGDTAETGTELAALTAAGIASARSFDTTALPTDIPPADDVPGRVNCYVSATDEAAGEERFAVDTDSVAFDYHLVPLRLTASVTAFSMFERNSLTGAFSLEINHGSAVSVSCSAPDDSVVGTIDIPSVTTAGVSVNVNWNSSSADMQSTDTVEITCQPGSEANGWTPGEDVVTLTATVQPIRLRVMYGSVEITNDSTPLFEIYEQQDTSTALDIMTNANHNGSANSTVNVECTASPTGYIAVDGTINSVGTAGEDVPLVAVTPSEEGYQDVPKGATPEVTFTCGATTASATGGLTDGTVVTTDKVTFRVRVLPIEATIRTVSNSSVTLRYSTGDVRVVANTDVGTLPVVITEGDNLNNRLKISLSASPAASVAFECSTGAPLDPTGTVVPVSVPTTRERNISYPSTFANSVPPTGSSLTSICRVTGETNTTGVAPGESVSVTIQYVPKRIYAVGGTAAEDLDGDAIDGFTLTTEQEWLAVLADEDLTDLEMAIALANLEYSMPAVYEGTAIGSNLVSIAANRDIGVAGTVACALAEGSPEGVIDAPAEAFTLNATGTTSIPFDTTAAAVDVETYVWFDCVVDENIVGGTSPDTYTIMGSGEGFTFGILVLPIELHILHP